MCKVLQSGMEQTWHLSVDPGTREMGWALWRGTSLVQCGLARGKTWTGTVRKMPELPCVDVLTLEDQQIYRSSPVDAHALLAVARVVGAVVAFYDYPKHSLVKPAKWKGQVPKKICNERTLKALSQIETEVVGNVKCPASLRHNLLDAIGIGLWAVGRRKR